MKTITKKQLLVTIIRDDLINHRLITGLENLGLSSDSYCIHAAQTVFTLMNIQEEIGHEIHFTYYMQLKQQVMTLNLDRDYLQLNTLAEKIYRELKAIQAAGI